MPPRSRPYKDIKTEIMVNIKTGIYKLVMKTSTNIEIWKKFAMIQKADGSMIDGYYCCIECNKIQLVGNYVGNLYPHLSKCTGKLNAEAKHNVSIHTIIKYNRNDILQKLKEGVYKVVYQSSSSQPIWKKFAKIGKADGSILAGYCCCIKCLQVFQLTSNHIMGSLYTHLKLCANRDVNKSAAVLREKKSLEEIEDDIKSKIRNQFIKRTRKKSIKNTGKEVEPIDGGSCELEDGTITASVDDELLQEEKSFCRNKTWQTFSLTLTDECKEVLHCRQCKMVLQFDYISKSRIDMHVCPSADNKRNYRKLLPSSREIEEKVKLEVSKKIETGIFKLTENQNSLSLVWKVYDQITRPNGAKLYDYACCSICKKVLKLYALRTSNLYTHTCYKEFLQLRSKAMDGMCDKGETTKNVEDKVKAGIYKMRHSRMTKNRIWDNFSMISKADGSFIKDMVCCRLCQEVWEYNDQSNEDILLQHKCLKVKERSEIREYDTDIGMEKVNLEIRSKLSTPYNNDNEEKEKEYRIKNLRTNKKQDYTLSDDSSTYSSSPAEMEVSNEAENKDKHNDDSLLAYKRTIGKKLMRLPGRKNKSKLYNKDHDEEEWKPPNKRQLNYNKNEEEKEYRRKRRRTNKEQKDSNTNSSSPAEIKDSNEAKLKRNLCGVKNSKLYNKNQDQKEWRESNKRRRPSFDNEDSTFSHDSNINSSSLAEIRVSNEVENMENIDQQHLSYDNNDDDAAIWLRFENISLDDGSILEGVVGCRQCKMVLKYDGTTKVLLELHKCSAKASLPTTIVNGNDVEFTTSSIKKITATRENEEIDDCYSICVKEEYNYSNSPEDNLNKNDLEHYSSHESLQISLNEESSHESLQIAVNEEEYQKLVDAFNDSHSPMETEKELSSCVSYGISNKENNNDSIRVNEEISNTNSLNEKDKEDIVLVDICSSSSELDSLMEPSHEVKFNEIIHIDTSTKSQNIPERNTKEKRMEIKSAIKETSRKASKTIDFFSSNIVKQNFFKTTQETRMEIKSKIKENSGKAAITIDFWSDDIAKGNFFKATLHINKDEEISNIILGVKFLDISQTSKSNYSQTIQNKLQKLLENYGMNNFKALVFVTEVDNNMEKALNNCTYLKCSRYLFENVLNSALENTPELSDLTKSCQALVDLYNSSSEHKSLEINPENLSKPPYGLFKTITNNWNKVAEILKANQESLRICDTPVFSTLQSLVKLCKNFELIFKRLQESHSSSLCFVVPSIQRLKMLADTTSYDVPEIKAFKANLLKYLEEIWLTNITIWHKAACFLYPPANREQENHLNEIKEFCIKQMKELKVNQVDRAENVDNLAAETDEFDFFFPNLINRFENNKEEEEIQSYCQENIMINKNFNVFQWWHSNSTKYPLLSRVALHILAIPASTTGSKEGIPVLNETLISENGFDSKSSQEIICID